jgi:hypothetical protein
LLLTSSGGAFESVNQKPNRFKSFGADLAILFFCSQTSSVRPPLLKGFEARPPLVTDIDLSMDDRFLYVARWGIAHLFHQFAVRAITARADRARAFHRNDRTEARPKPAR